MSGTENNTKGSHFSNCYKWETSLSRSVLCSTRQAERAPVPCGFFILPLEEFEAVMGFNWLRTLGKMQLQFFWEMAVVIGKENRTQAATSIAGNSTLGGHCYIDH